MTARVRDSGLIDVCVFISVMRRLSDSNVFHYAVPVVIPVLNRESPSLFFAYSKDMPETNLIQAVEIVKN